jgi:hypothetical protein
MFFGNCFLRPDYDGDRQRNIGRARKCLRKFFGDDPATNRNASKQSIGQEA